MNCKNRVIILSIIISFFGSNIYAEGYPRGLIDTGNCGNPDYVNKSNEPVVCAISAPRYPRKAINKGTEGYVRMEFDILPNGRAVNIKVIEAEPNRVFVRAAKKTIRKWIFEIKFIDQKAVRQKGVVYTMSFKLG